MSMKTRILLQRSGRDQFGDAGEGYITYQPAGLSSREKAEYHAAVDAFFERYWPKWQKFCGGMASRDVWACLFPRGKPALATFEKQRRAFVSLDEFLKYALVLYRWYALRAMGYSDTGTRTILERYEALGRFCIEPQIGKRKPGRSAGYVARVY